MAKLDRRLTIKLYMLYASMVQSMHVWLLRICVYCNQTSDQYDSHVFTSNFIDA